jgi:hypothetical protein
VVDPDVRVVHKMSYSRAAVLAGLVGALVGLSAFGVAVFLLGSYGASLFIGAPPIGGFVAGLLFARWHRPKFAGSILSGVLAVVIAGMLVIGFALEGLICLAMAFPLVLVGSVMGAGIGCLLERTTNGAGLTPTATALSFFPLTLIAESLNPLPVPDALPVETSIVIDAPVERVWSNVVAFPQLPPADEWIFKVGIAAPVGAVIDGNGPGAVRRCIFTTGSFVEPIEIGDPPHELTFSVTSSPEPMQEWTIWGGPKPPHIEGYLESVRGQFQLTPLSGGQTRLIGRTWYRTNMVPERYWRLWSDPIIHAIHLKVLRHVAALSERTE